MHPHPLEEGIGCRPDGDVATTDAWMCSGNRRQYAHRVVVKVHTKWDELATYLSMHVTLTSLITVLLYRPCWECPHTPWPFCTSAFAPASIKIMAISLLPKSAACRLATIIDQHNACHKLAATSMHASPLVVRFLINLEIRRHRLCMFSMTKQCEGMHCVLMFAAACQYPRLLPPLVILK